MSVLLSVGFSTRQAACPSCNTPTISYRRSFQSTECVMAPRVISRVRSYAVMMPARDPGPLRDALGRPGPGPVTQLPQHRNWASVEIVVGPSAKWKCARADDD